ncbi:hypothetical protein FRC12_022908, partial [Ceratobasidium sp. 428]
MSSTQRNPDQRALPPGWVQQFESKRHSSALSTRLLTVYLEFYSYNAWFYVNTNANPPKTQWTHPADDKPPAPAPPSFAPPSGPPPPQGGQSPYPQGGSSPYPMGGGGGGPGFPQPSPGGNSPYPQGGNSPYPQGNNPYPPSNGPYGGTP